MLVMDETLSRALVLTKLRGPSFLINKDNFPGGHIEEGETPEEGAIRETAEEANVQINLGQAILGYTETATKTDSKYRCK